MKKSSKQKSISNLLNNSLLFTLGLLITSIALSFLSSRLILFLFPNRAISPDLIFLFTKYNYYFEYLSDVLPYVACVIFALDTLKNNWKNIFFILNNVSVMYIGWSILKVFTPLMRPTGIDMPSHGFFKDYILQTGMFPSGHVALTAVMYFLTKRDENPKLKNILLIILIIESITMVISRGHYSIDIIGGLLLSYFVVSEMKKFELQSNA